MKKYGSRLNWKMVEVFSGAREVAKNQRSNRLAMASTLGYVV